MFMVKKHFHCLNTVYFSRNADANCTHSVVAYRSESGESKRWRWHNSSLKAGVSIKSLKVMINKVLANKLTC